MELVISESYQLQAPVHCLDILGLLGKVYNTNLPTFFGLCRKPQKNRRLSSPTIERFREVLSASW